MGGFCPKRSANIEWQNQNRSGGGSSACLWGGSAGGGEDQSHLQQQHRQNQGKRVLLGTIWFLIFQFYQCLCPSVPDQTITKRAAESKEWGGGKPNFAVPWMRSSSSTGWWRNKGNGARSGMGWQFQRPGAGLEQEQSFMYLKSSLNSMQPPSSVSRVALLSQATALLWTSPEQMSMG